MGMTIESTIDKEKQLYNKHINAANHIREKMVSEIAMNNAKEHDEIAEEHRQIAEWLEKYQKIEQIYLKWNRNYDISTSDAWTELIGVLEDGKID